MLTRVALALAALLTLHAAVMTPFWASVSRAVRDPRGYAERRIALAFSGLQVDDIQRALDEALPLDVPVCLDERLGGRDVHQRVTEALYPRRVDREAEHRLVLGRAPPMPAIALTGDGRERVWLQGPIRVGDEARAPRLELSWLAFASSLAAVLGLGGAPLLLVRRRWPGALPWDPPTLVALALLAGAATLGLLTEVASALQAPLLGVSTTLIGVALATGVAAALERSGVGGRALAARLLAPLRAPETWLLVLLLLAFLVRQALQPVTLWDGRSIWLLRAKQLALQGTFLRAEALHEPLHWSHLDYPLLLPGWLAHFGAGRGGWNERLAALGMPVLFAALLALVWRLSRERLGRWQGAALTVTALLGLENLTGGAYADGLVALLLLAALLALLTPGGEVTGCLCALVASLTKREGLPLAALLLGAALLLEARRRGASWRRAAPLLALAPGVAHALAVRALGVPTDYVDLPWGTIAGSLGPRLWTIGAGAIEHAPRLPLLSEGAAGLLAALVAVVAGRRGAEGGLALAVGLGAVAFAVTALLITPLDVEWHVRFAVDRLLLHGALIFVAAPLLLLRETSAEAVGYVVRSGPSATPPSPSP